MDALIDSIFKAFSKPENVAVLVSMLMNVGMGWFIVTTRREERSDKQNLLDLLTKNTEALGGLKNVLSAITGKAV